MSMNLPLILTCGGYPLERFDPWFLGDDAGTPFVLIGIVYLFYAYNKMKTKPYDFYEGEVEIDLDKKFSFQSYDVLMQPKEDFKIPKKSTSFTYKKTLYFLLVLMVILLVVVSL